MYSVTLGFNSCVFALTSNLIYFYREVLGGTGSYESGVVPKQGSRSDITGLAEMAADPSKGLGEVMQSAPDLYLKYFRGVSAIRSLVTGRRDFKTEVYWLYGPTGTGKSRFANAAAPSAYWKPGGNKWWCQYEAQEDVIIDDYRRDLCTFSELLRMFDRYPYLVEGKGVTMQFMAKRIFITTPKTLEDTWEGRTEEDINQLNRRVEFIIRFTDTNAYVMKGEPSVDILNLLNSKDN